MGSSIRTDDSLLRILRHTVSAQDDGQGNLLVFGRSPEEVAVIFQSYDGELDWFEKEVHGHA